jgi:hypothetical protein
VRNLPPDPEPPDPPAPEVVPRHDVRNRIVCGRPLKARPYPYVCRAGGYIIDCLDAY